MNARPQLLIGSIVGVALFACLLLLRMSVEKGPDSETVSSTRIRTVDEYGRLSSPVGRTNITRFTDGSPVERKAGGAKATRMKPVETQEDFEAQKFRTFGNESVYGIITGDKGRLEGATVQLYENDPMTRNPPLREATADKNGSYTLEQLNDSEMRYIFVVRAEGYAPEAHFIQLNQGSLRRDGRLRPGSALSGVVRDAVTSAPIANATVYFPTQSETVFAMLGSVQTGPAGQFSFPHVRENQVLTYAEKDGYHRTAKKIKTPTAEAEIPMKPGGGTIRGVTVSRLTQKPEGGAKVVLKMDDFSATAMSGTDGTFEMKDLPEGEFRLFAIKGISSDVQKIKLADREVKEDVKIILPSPIFVTGKVVHAYGSQPLPGIKVHYESPRGKMAAMTDELGQFGFETFALRDYGIEIHEKGFLPYIDKRSTGSVERLSRKIAQNAASDQLLIKLRPVPSVSGRVKMQTRNRDGGEQRERPVHNASVAVAYLQGKTYERVITRTDATGNFFVNLPERQAAQAKVIVQHRGMTAVESARVPQREKLELLLRPDYFSASLSLSDGSSLSGVLVKTNYYFPDNRKPEDAIELPAGEVVTSRGGRFFLTLPERQQIGFRFFLPDGKTITKNFNTSRLKRQSLFVYDPVTGDILTDAVRESDRDRQNRGGGQRQGGDSRGQGNNSQRQQGNQQNRPQSQQQKPAT